MKTSLKRTVFFISAAALIGATLTGCGDEKASDVKVVKIGVVGEYNAQWETVNQNLASDKIRVELVKYSHYATPNRARSDKEIDLNACQHKAFLANDIARNGWVADFSDPINMLEMWTTESGNNDCQFGR